MPDYLFAYGTLQPGAAPAEIAGAAAQLKAIGAGCVRGRLYDLGHFPGAVLDGAGNEQGKIDQCGDQKQGSDQDQGGDQNNARHVIYGTVFELPRDPEILAALDTYEEFDPENAAASQFVRTSCIVSLALGAAMECWIYVYNRGVKNAPVVEGGRWNAGTISE